VLYQNDAFVEGCAAALAGMVEAAAAAPRR
jgi:hypothetical protein